MALLQLGGFDQCNHSNQCGPVELSEDRLRFALTKEGSNGVDLEPHIVGGRRPERQRFCLQSFPPEYDQGRCVSHVKPASVEFHRVQAAQQ